MSDAKLGGCVHSRYYPDNWDSDILLGWDFFLQNIYASIDQSANNHNLNYIENISPSSAFPARQLTKSEHSIARRHLYALKMISNSQSPCIVLEDDAIVANENLFFELINFINDWKKQHIFFDLTDEFIPVNCNEKRAFNSGNLKFSMRSIAITRTLMAYAIFPETAYQLYNSMKEYSLPIDMQFQVALKVLGLPGLSIINSPFSHGSKIGNNPSSVYQN
ncbi:glycosyltransferase family 25 protein [Synechococcus sp. MU1642]|uniref:glycosyltransferase family 25 protein n=1 Tax=Synechococcus sp. MU1642 TaxID=2508348 RepID=UPI001CF893E7|nr:glycosyltransferase family 25 protein [Synechococcus sp. MU1642]